MSKEKFVIIIVNSIQPYCYELNNILSLPDDFSYRFRYQKKKQGNWMPEITNPNDLKNNKGLIVLRDFQDTAEFIPVRKIYIYNVIMIGDIVYIEYLLKEKIELSSKLDERERQINLFNQRIATDINITKYPNLPGKDLNNLIFFGTDYTYDVSDTTYNGNLNDRDSNKWGNIIETIGLYKGKGISVYKDSDFLKIIGIQDENGEYAKIGKENTKVFYKLENKTVYKIIFLQRAFTGKSSIGDSSVLTPRTIELKAGNPDIIPIISRKEIMGKYDLLELTFKSNISSASLKSYLLLEISEAGPKKSPTITIPIKISLSKQEFYLNVLFVILFVILFFSYLYSSEVILAFNSKTKVTQEIINNQIISFKNILLPLMIVFGSNTFKSIKNIKEFIFGRINL